MQTFDPDTLINRAEVKSQLGVSERGLIVLLEKGILPLPKRARNKPVWLQSDIDYAMAVVNQLVFVRRGDAKAH